MSVMRSAKDTEIFPYLINTMCYFEVNSRGEVSRLPHKNKSDRPGVLEAYRRAVSGETTLYAVWPGQWRSDLFQIDDLERFKEAFDLKA